MLGISHTTLANNPINFKLRMSWPISTDLTHCTAIYRSPRHTCKPLDLGQQLAGPHGLESLNRLDLMKFNPES